MPTSGFEVRGNIVRQHSPQFAKVHFVVECQGQQFAGVAVRVAVKAGGRWWDPDHTQSSPPEKTVREIAREKIDLKPDEFAGAGLR